MNAIIRYLIVLIISLPAVVHGSADQKAFYDAVNVHAKLTLDESIQKPIKKYIPQHILEALKVDNVVALKKFFSHEGGTIDVINKHGANMLIVAAVGQCINCVNELISRRVNVNAIDSTGLTAVRAAAARGNLPILENLAKAGANLKVIDKRGNTLLHWVAYGTAHIKVADYLIKNGVPINATNKIGKTVLDIAKERRLDQLLAFLNASANPRLFLPMDIKEAVKWDDLGRMTEYLKTAGAINAVTQDYFMTLLMLAAQEGHMDMVKELIKRKADLDVVDNRGWSALTHAHINNYPNIVQVLKDAGAQIDSMLSLRKELFEADKKFHKEPIDTFSNNGVAAPADADQTEPMKPAKPISPTVTPRDEDCFPNIAG
jgi:ankyrin repeat protein